MSAIARLALSEKALKKIYETSDQRTHTFQKKQRRSKKWNREREEKLSEEIRNEAEIDGIPKVRRRRDSSENRVQERIVAAVNGRVPEDEESRDYKERKERAFAKVSEEANFLPSILHLALEER